MTCVCGGLLHEDLATTQNQLMSVVNAIAGPLPQHKKRRIREKWRKVWAAKVRIAVIMSYPLTKPSFVCAECSQQKSFYGAIGENLFQIEKLPPADTIYF